MNPSESERWKSEVLDEILVALAADSGTPKCLVFKAARILNARLGLGAGRQSLDLDSNMTKEFVEGRPDRGEQRQYLELFLQRALSRQFERRDPVRFELKRVGIDPRPPQSHPLGWHGFRARLTVIDLARSGTRGLPGIEIDLAAPEELLSSSVSPLTIDGHSLNAYTLERIAGEKLRAFLSSLPAYKRKINKQDVSIRAKDLYDLVRIHQAFPCSESDFWERVGGEFHIACRSRYVDCEGLESWDVTSDSYTKDPTIPADVGLERARHTLAEIVARLIEYKIIPFRFPIDPSQGQDRANPRGARV